MPTYYATFQDAADAERAAGALIDHGVARDDLTITSKGVSTLHAHNPRYESEMQSAENEGWPVRPDSMIASQKQSADERDNEANSRYQEADKAERSAKRGISVTTIDDVVIGALRGGFVGVCAGIVAFYATVHSAAISPADFILAGGVGLAGGTTIGAVVGLFADQGTRGHYRRPRNTKGKERPVLLVVDTSSGRFTDGEARRLIAKYHASSIEMSR